MVHRIEEIQTTNIIGRIIGNDDIDGCARERRERRADRSRS
jgi:hypothetical protein